jgi:hypothetical protein
MAQIEYNENYVHSCNNAKVEMVVYRKNLSDSTASVYTPEQFQSIIDYYVSKAPVIKNNGAGDAFGLRSLSEIGWKGSGLGTLERELIKSSEMTLVFIRSDAITHTLKAMDLDTRICCEHPRAVLKQSFKLKAKENGEIEVTNSETRMECLFRHIRNSLAHGRTYIFNNSNIMLEDCDDNGVLSARILIKAQTLIDWMAIIDHPDNYLNKQKKSSS